MSNGKHVEPKPPRVIKIPRLPSININWNAVTDAAVGFGVVFAIFIGGLFGGWIVNDVIHPAVFKVSIPGPTVTITQTPQPIFITVNPSPSSTRRP